MSGSGWEALADVREWSAGPRRCPGVVGMPSRMSGSGRECSCGPPGCPGVVVRPFRIFGSARVALLDVREW